MPSTEVVTKTKTSPADETHTVDLELDELLGHLPISLAEGASSQNLQEPSVFTDMSPVAESVLFTGPGLRVGPSTIDVSEADLYLARLETTYAMLNAKVDGLAEFRAHVRNAKKVIDEVAQSNLQRVLAEQRPMEKAWTELSVFNKLARTSPNRPVPLRVANVSVERLLEDDAAFKQVAKMVPQRTALTMEDMVSILVVPTPVGFESKMKKFAELARDGLAVAILALEDEDPEKMRVHFNGGKYAALKSTSDYAEHLVLAYNPMCYRKEDPIYEQGLGDLWLSPAVVLAAMIVNGDETCGMAVAQAGDKQKLLLDCPDFALRHQLTDRLDILETFRECAIPMVRRKAGVVTWWGNENTSTHRDFKQLTVARPKHFIQKVAIETLNCRTWEPNTDDFKKETEQVLNAFLRSVSSDRDTKKILRGGIVTKIEDAVDDSGELLPDQVRIEMELKFKYALKSGEVRIVPHRLKMQAKLHESGTWGLVEEAA